MKPCTHIELTRKLRAEAVVKNELRKEIADLLGVTHLRGEPQLRAAVDAIKRLKETPNDGGEQHYKTQEYARRLSGL